MGMAFQRAAERAAAGLEVTALSGRVMGQLEEPEQLVIWAFRQAAAGGAMAERRLLEGFRLVFGASGAAAAACGFDGMRRCFAAEPDRAPRLCRLSCACLSRDEDRLLYAVAAAQLGDRTLHGALVRTFVGDALRLQLWRQTRLFAAALLRVDLALPDRRLVELETRAAAH